MSSWHLLPLRWMQPSDKTNEDVKKPGCTFSNEHGRTCTTEIQNGIPVERCKEYYSLIRHCPGSEPEEVMKKETETVTRLDNAAQSGSPAGPSGSIYAPDVGQMFDDFFHFAAEVERDVLGNYGIAPNQHDRSTSINGVEPPDIHSGAAKRFFWEGPGTKGTADNRAQLYELFGRNIQQI